MARITTPVTTAGTTRLIGFRHPVTARATDYTDGQTTVTLIHLKSGALSRLCDKCGGTGFLLQYAHCHDGVCYACNGSGLGGNPYTDAKTAMTRVRAILTRRRNQAAKWAAEAEAAAAAYAARLDTFNTWKTANAELVTAITDGAKAGNKFLTAIRDETLAAAEIPNDHALTIVRRIMDEAAASRWFGTEKERVTLTGVIAATSSFEVQDAARPWTTCWKALVVITGTGEFAGCTFKFVGTASALFDLLDSKGAEITVTATVKGHADYQGVKQTTMMRPKIVALAA